MAGTETGVVEMKRSGKVKVHFGRHALGLPSALGQSAGAPGQYTASESSQTLSSNLPPNPWLHEDLRGQREILYLLPFHFSVFLLRLWYASQDPAL